MPAREGRERCGRAAEEPDPWGRVNSNGPREQHRPKGWYREPSRGARAHVVGGGVRPRVNDERPAGDVDVTHSGDHLSWARVEQAQLLDHALEPAPATLRPRLVITEGAGQVGVFDARHERQKGLRVVDVEGNRVDGFQARLLRLGGLWHRAIVEPDVPIRHVVGELLWCDLGKREGACLILEVVGKPLLLRSEDRAELTFAASSEQLLRRAQLDAARVWMREGAPLMADEEDASQARRPLDEVAASGECLVREHALE